MCTVGDQTVARPRSPWFQFSLRALLLAAAFVGVFIDFVVHYGPGFGIALGTLTVLGCVFVVQAFRGWRSFGPVRRFFACIEAGAWGVVFAAILLAVVTTPAFVREGTATRLRHVLGQDGRFSSVHAEYTAGKQNLLQVDGRVDSESDFDALRKIVTPYEHGDISWHVTIVSTKHTYDGWDSKLFGDGSR